MEASANRRTSILPSATTLVSATTIAAAASSSSPSLSTNYAETASSSPYLLPELIPLIANRLTSLQDFFALRAACRTYRALLPPSPSTLASQTPLLLVPRKASAWEALLRFCLPRNCLARCDPTLATFSSFGCRVAIHDRYIDASHRHRRPHVRHLLTSDRARLPDPQKEFDGVVFSGNLVLTFAQYHCVLHYCRIGDAHWRAARCDGGYLIYNLMFMEGTLYALVVPNYRLAVVELCKDSVKLSFLGDETSIPTVPHGSVLSLAECDGELLLVVAVQHSPLYQVYRWQSVDRKWARTTSLGGCSLLFNRHQFAGCLGPDHPAVRRDCIYYAWFSGQWSVYSLVEGSWQPHNVDYPGRAATHGYGAMAWVLPSIG